MDITSFLLGYESGKTAGDVVTDIDAMLDEINGENINGMIVTFVGVDGTVLHEAVVTPGFDCADPKIPTPTKEPTQANVFTFNGWSLVEGGEADENALKNVTADRTVYAAFATGTRYYNVKFYDDTGKFVKTEPVAYMGSSTFVHHKTGAYFQYWTPEPVNVETDMECYGTWVYASFAADSWETIASNARNGVAAEYYSVGDEREIQLVTQSGAETIIVRIVGINTNETVVYPDGTTGTSGIAIMTKNPPVQSLMKYSTKEDTLNGGNLVSPLWYGFANSDALEYLNNTVIPALPTKLCNVLTSTRKKYSKYGGGLSNPIATGDFRLWVPSLREVGGSDSALNGEGTAYSAYGTVGNNAQDSRVVTLFGDNAGVGWWLRSVQANNTSYAVNESGSLVKGYVDNDLKYIIFGFCL